MRTPEGYIVGRPVQSLMDWTLADVQAIPQETDADLLSDRVAAQGVRDMLDGKLDGPPLPGTLADRVSDAIIKIVSDTLDLALRMRS